MARKRRPSAWEATVDNVRERVGRVIARQFQVADERIVESAVLDEDLGATSLDRVEVVMSLEDEFSIEIFDEEASHLNTVAGVLACVSAGVERRTAPIAAL